MGITIISKQELVIIHDFLLFYMDETLTSLKKSATLLPNNWLAETPQALALMRLGRQSAERERISEIKLELFLNKALLKINVDF
ncbi:hypothetical protein [Peribacillus sp. ACCC06369]|uniref:hypothetical protein n=1 Tax=Peribacillus sp. ACCC06369 TaxID=3055860 RepID=UPI0025A149B8|nr:hypothetical protein [Peribacillus sp. ACCC06369]MDM5360542.1 hypothetical protein [Peribacillus sp. ACCC06369]